MERIVTFSIWKLRARGVQIKLNAPANTAFKHCKKTKQNTHTHTIGDVKREFVGHHAHFGRQDRAGGGGGEATGSFSADGRAFFPCFVSRLLRVG